MDWLIAGFVLIAAALVLRSNVRLTVTTGTVALLYRNGLFERELPPGRHRWFDLSGATKTTIVPVIRQVLSTNEVTVLTKDQFSFRIALTPIGEIENARAFHEAKPVEAAGWPGQFGLGFQELAPALQAATISSVAHFTLDEFLADTDAILPPIREKLAPALPGTRLLELLITSITMPPEVRKMFTEVERAKRESLASLERARGEQASMRALANAARALQSNPQLAHLRLLQTIENTKGSKTFVLGQGDPSQLLRQPAD